MNLKKSWSQPVITSIASMENAQGGTGLPKSVIVIEATFDGQGS